MQGYNMESGYQKRNKILGHGNLVTLEGSLGITTLFNDTFGMILNLIQSVSLPHISDGMLRKEDLSTMMIFRPEVLVLADDWYMRFGVDLYGYPTGLPFIITFTFGCTIEVGKR
jgi:hypothetical protein